MTTGAPVLQFLGGVGTVTGSKYLVEHEGRTLVDCGLFQGLRDLRRRNWAPFPIDADTIDEVVLTHAHLDHCGYLPALVKAGFAGPVWATPNTIRLVEIILRDSAHLQEEDARYARERGFSKHEPPLALYDGKDAEAAIALMRPVPFGTDHVLRHAASVRFQSAGHILGAASVLLTVDSRRVLFSGDLGRPDHPLLAAPPPPPQADVVLVESTYGARLHQDTDVSEMAQAITRTAARGGVVLIPAFAVDRTEVLLHALRGLMREGRIPRLPVYADSPMALASLDVYRDALRDRSPELRPGLMADGDPFDPGTLHEARTPDESKALNQPSSSCIIVSASGMGTGGRVVHHLKHLLPDRRNTVLLVGYQAAGTRGRSLLDGAQQLKMHGEYVPVRAEVVNAPYFSAHADADDIVRWCGSMPAPPTTAYVVHGETEGAETIARRLHDELGWTAVVPKPGERVRL